MKIKINYSIVVSAWILLFPIKVNYDTINVKEIKYNFVNDSFSNPPLFIQLLSVFLKSFDI